MSSPATAAGVAAPLAQGAGYGVIIGIGALFAFGMWAIAVLLAKFQNEVQGSEMFMTAKRSIGTGLVASAVVSGWTIAATLLTSSSWTYSYGVSGAYYYGAGASVQIFVFAVGAIELKRRAPSVNILVGGSAVFTALTGMNDLAAVWLLPVGVVIYTLTGGIKATILTDYVHTIIIYVMILTGLFVVYCRSNLIGSPGVMYDLLRAAAQRAPVPGNSGGEYLTMSSQSGILLGVVFWCAVFGSTVDVQLFQKAIAANPASTLPGYMIGGLAWFAIPFCLATTFGLAARALETNPSFPTYPRLMTTVEVSQGLPFPYAAQALMGKGGSFFVLLMTFMACTSGFSADIVAVASVFTYDIYGAYINPNASGGRLLKMSHIAVVVWSVCMAVIATGITRTTIGVNYLVTCMGVFTCSMVFPMYSTILWRRQNRVAIIVAPIAGSLTAIACWLLSAKALEGSITIDTTSAILPLAIGNGTSLACGILYSIICSYAFGPEDFDWERFKTVRVVDDSDVQGVSKEQLEQQLKRELLSPEEERRLRRGKKQGIVLAAVLCAIFVVLWPLPMYGTRYIFSPGFFVGWVVVTFMIAWAASLVIVLMPIWQGRHTLMVIWKYIIGSGVKGRRGGEKRSVEMWSEGSKTEPAGEETGKKA